MAKPSMGGQAVLEGVMMKAPERMALAVRRANGAINVTVEETEPAAKKHKALGWPIVRGVVSFVQSFTMGYKTITLSAKMLGEDFEEEQPSKFETWLSEKLGKKLEDVVMGVAMLLAIVLAAGLFIILPSLVATLLKQGIDNPTVVNLLEGLTRLIIFFGYLLSVSRLKDIKRVFMYHGAEHKTVYCYESDLPLTVENAKTFSRLHPRCGTSFLFIVMAISIVVFSVLGWDATWYTRILSRLLLMPVVAGVSYEVLRFLGMHEGRVVSILRWPGLMMQKLTTKEPSDDMLQVAIAAMNAALGLPWQQEDIKAEEAQGEEGAPYAAQPASAAIE